MKSVKLGGDAGIPEFLLRCHNTAAFGLAIIASTHSQAMAMTASPLKQHLQHCFQAVAENPHVVVLRDQDTIEALADKLPGMRRVVLVGNGGIALEIAHALSGVEVSTCGI